MSTLTEVFHRRSKSSRRWNRFIGNLLFTALSLLYVIPNALIAIFLSNMNNIGLVGKFVLVVGLFFSQMPSFGQNLTIFWQGIIRVLPLCKSHRRRTRICADYCRQGFAAPTVTSLIYLLLPICMRRLSKWQGDLTRSSRERHVVSKLYVFFIINNLIIFTIFSVCPK